MVVPTAEQFLTKNLGHGSKDMEFQMREFAKLHVKAALDKVYEESKHGDQEHMDWLKDKFDAYPYENIK